MHVNCRDAGPHWTHLSLYPDPGRLLGTRKAGRQGRRGNLLARRSHARPVRLRPALAALSNPHFDHALFPLRTPHTEYLPRYAEVFDALELAALYHDPVPSQRILGWAAQAPPGFRFPVKLWKAAVDPRSPVVPTGRKTRLGEPAPWAERALAHATEALDALAPLRRSGRLGPLVAQFPPRFTADDAHRAFLARLLGRLGDAGPAAVELRHRSWWTPATRHLLEEHGVALVWSTYDGAETPPWATAMFGYVRLTGTARPRRGRPVHVRDRTEALLSLRAALADEPWDEAYLVVTNGFEGNAVDSLPTALAAVGLVEQAVRCRRAPGRPLFPEPPAGKPFMTGAG